MMTRTFWALCLLSLAGCSEETSKQIEVQAEPPKAPQSAELRFNATEAHPALRIQLQWYGGLTGAQLVPRVNQALYQIATECVGASSLTHKGPHEFEIEVSSLVVRSARKLPSEIQECMNAKVGQIRFSKDVRKPLKLMVAVWAKP
jgi:hypothetical protein